MKLIDELRAEHGQIEQVLGSLRAWVDGRRGGFGDPADGARFVAFFRDWAGHHHHAREETVLFPELAARLELPVERGPIVVFTGDHQRLGGVFEGLTPLLLAGGVGAEATRLAIEYSRGLWLHLDAENSVLFPEAEFRLTRVGCAELPLTAPSPEQLRARDEGLALVARYPPIEDLAIIRGEGCVICPAFGTRCDGVEKEWWSESEWEELPHRVG